MQKTRKEEGGCWGVLVGEKHMKSGKGVVRNKNSYTHMKMSKIKTNDEKNLLELFLHNWMKAHWLWYKIFSLSVAQVFPFYPLSEECLCSEGFALERRQIVGGIFSYRLLACRVYPPTGQCPSDFRSWSY